MSSISTSDEDDSQVDNTVVIRPRPDDRRPATVRVELPSYPQLVVGKKLEVISFGITFVLTNFGGGGGEVLQ